MNWWRDPAKGEQLRLGWALCMVAGIVLLCIGLALRNPVLKAVGIILSFPSLGFLAFFVVAVSWEYVSRKFKNR